MTRLREFFGTKMGPVAEEMGVPVDWLKEDLHRLMSHTPSRSSFESAPVDARLTNIYPARLLDTLVLHYSDDDLFRFARHWAALKPGSVSEEYLQPLKQKKAQELIDHGRGSGFTVFALRAWREMIYLPSKGDWKAR